MASAVTVRQLNLYIKSLLEGDSRLAFVTVTGEISNFKRHFASGHLYFTLKDDTAALKCVMFSANASNLKFMPSDGMKVVCTGRVSVYERDGSYQLYTESMSPAGDGDLLAKLEKLKMRLEAEGLFAPERKRSIPRFPSKLAVVTSETGAAVKDILNILSRRYPLCGIVLCPATVQGITAPDSLCEALDLAEKTGADTVIIGRGGGSAEDLWCFNDEKLVRKVAGLSVPIISAVGHETDFTLCDFAADLRAPTPSAAAELAVPDAEELLYNIRTFKAAIQSSADMLISSRKDGLDALMSSGAFASPEEFICGKRELLLASAKSQVAGRALSVCLKKEASFASVAASIDALSPIKTMLRGYSAVLKDGVTVNSADRLGVGDSITVKFARGGADCRVEKIIKE